MRSAEDKRNRILENAFRLISSYGFSRVTIEEIAKSSGVGKATVYQLFESKQALMLAAIDYLAGKMESGFEAVLSDGWLPPADKLRLFMKTISDVLSRVRPEVLRGLETEFPEAYDKIRSTRERLILSKLTAIIRDGKQAGYFDIFLDEFIAAHVVIGAMDHFQGPVLSQFDCSVDEVFKSVISVIMKGFLTDEYRNILG